MRFKLALAAIAVVIVASASAQPMPTAPPELEKMAWMAGTWSGKMNWTMEGMPAQSGEMSFKCEKDGMFLKSTSTMDMGGMKFTEVSYMWWDGAKKRYSMATFTNFAATPRFEYGTFENNKFVMISEPWDVGMPDGPTSSRATMIKKSDTEASFVMEFKQGDKWVKVSEGTFTKKKA